MWPVSAGILWQLEGSLDSIEGPCLSLGTWKLLCPEKSEECTRLRYLMVPGKNSVQVGIIKQNEPAIYKRTYIGRSSS